MAGTKVGDIHVDFTGDYSGVEKAGQQIPRILDSIEKRVSGSLDSIGSSLKRMGALFVAQFSARAVVNAIDELINRQKDLKNSAESLGIAARDLALYQYALKQVGIEGQDTTAIIRTLYQRMLDKEVLSEGVRVFSALGVSVKNSNGTLKSFTEILPELANKFAGMTDGVAKTRLAVQLFGEKGLELLPFLNRGAAGIEELTAKAQKLGVAFDAEANANAVRLHRTMGELGAQTSKLTDDFFNRLVPSLQIYADAVKKATESSSQMSAGLEMAALGVKAIMAALDAVLSAFVSKTQLVVAAVKAVGQALTFDFAGATDTMKKGFEEATQTMTDFINRTGKSFGYLKEAGTLFKEEFTRIAPPVVKTSEEISRAIRYAVQSIMQSNLLSPAEKMAQMKQMLDRGKIQWEEYATAVREISMKMEQDALARVIDLDTQPALNKLKALEEAKAKGVIGWNEYSMAVDRVNKQSAQNMDDLVGAVGSSLTQIFKKSKAAAIASALINTYQGITKAIAQYPPPISYAMAGIQAALGFAQVAAIRSQNESGGGGGATTAVGAATPADASGPAPKMQQQTMMVKGIDPRSLFTGDAVRSLAEQLLQYQRDGGRVILA